MESVIPVVGETRVLVQRKKVKERPVPHRKKKGQP